jgi:hypothetical protein
LKKKKNIALAVVSLKFAMARKWTKQQSQTLALIVYKEDEMKEKNNGRLVVASVKPGTRHIGGVKIEKSHEYWIDTDTGYKEKIEAIGGVYSCDEYGKRGISHYSVKISECYDDKVVLDNILVMLEDNIKWRAE